MILDYLDFQWAFKNGVCLLGGSLWPIISMLSEADGGKIEWNHWCKLDSQLAFGKLENLLLGMWGHTLKCKQRSNCLLTPIIYKDAEKMAHLYISKGKQNVMAKLEKNFTFSLKTKH